MAKFFQSGHYGSSHGLFIIAASILLLSSCDPGEKKAPPPFEVSIVAPELSDVPIRREWVGTFTGAVNASILPQVSGYIKSQNYANGALVKKGEVLFQIDSSLFLYNLDQAKAKLAAAKAQWQEAEYNKNLYKPLSAENVVSKQQYENALSSSQAARANILGAQAEVNLAQRNLDYTIITSPIDGLAGIATVQVGDLASPSGRTLAVVSSVNPIRLNFAITQKEWLSQTEESRGIQKGSKVDIILANGEVYPLQAEVIAIDRAFDLSTGTIMVQAQIANEELKLRPGMFVRVRALISMEKDALTLPQKSIYSTQGRFFIVTLDKNNKPHMIPVETGPSMGDHIVVKALIPGSITEESRVVVEGVLQAIRDAAVGNANITIKPINK